MPELSEVRRQELLDVADGYARLAVWVSLVWPWLSYRSLKLSGKYYTKAYDGRWFVPDVDGVEHYFAALHKLEVP